jgi:hypothetical protein
MNIEPASQNEASTGQLQDILVKDNPVSTVNDQVAAALEDQLTREKDERRTERFGWVFVTTFLVLCLTAQHAPGSLIGLVPLAVVFLLFMAERCGVEEIAVPLRRILNKYLPKEGEPEEPKEK